MEILDLIKMVVEVVLSYVEIQDRERLMEEIFTAFRESQDRSELTRMEGSPYSNRVQGEIRVDQEGRIYVIFERDNNNDDVP